MRKIESVEEKEKKEKKRQMILGGILILVLTMSIAGYATLSNTGSDNTEKRTYNGLEFVYENGFWKTTLSGKDFVFYNLPYELENINISINKSIQDYNSDALYFVGDYPTTVPYDFEGLVVRMQNACLDGLNCTNIDYPIKTCDNNVLVFIDGNESQIYQKDNCIFLEGDLQKTSDKLIYNLLGIEI